MEFSARQRSALEDICQTFRPSEGGLPGPRELGVADAVLGALQAIRPAEQRQLAALLSVWDAPFMGALAGGGWTRFSTMTGEQREQVLLS